MKVGKWTALAVVALLAGAAALAGLVGDASGSSAATSVRAGLVSDVGKFNDKSFNQSQLNGLKQAQKELRVSARPIESRAASDYIPNLASLARQNYDIVIAAGFLLADATNTVAKRFPDVNFAITDYSSQAPPFAGKLKNVTGMTYAVQENSYLIGCMAALVAKRDGGNSIGVVGGVKIPPVDAFLAGYRAGARKCVPGIGVQIGYSQDFVAADKCKEVALNQIAKNAKVIFAVAGQCGLGAIDAAKENDLWAIGVDQDQSFLGPHILTSAVKRVDRGVFLTIKSVQDGEFKGGTDLVFNLKNAGVAIGKISPRAKLSTSIRKRVDGLRKQIIAGKIKPPAAL
jgi:basic membrane protein A